MPSSDRHPPNAEVRMKPARRAIGCDAAAHNAPAGGRLGIAGAEQFHASGYSSLALACPCGRGFTASMLLPTVDNARNFEWHRQMASSPPRPTDRRQREMSTGDAPFGERQMQLLPRVCCSDPPRHKRGSSRAFLRLAIANALAASSNEAAGCPDRPSIRRCTA